jgi:tetratricopeptide (TPR) repeat protein
VLTILPVLNLNGIGQSIFADRYLYIPTLGSCLLIPLLAQASVRLIPAKLSGLDSQAGATLLGIVLVVFSWQLWGEIGVWRNAPTLYHETMRRSPDSSVFAHNLGRYYINQGDLEQGREWERKALAASEKSFIPNLPNLAGIYGGLGTICLQQGKPNEALEYFQKAYKARPEEGAVLRNLATAYLDLKEYRNAMFFLQALVRSDPRNAIAYSDMAAVFLTVGQYDQAIANARRSLEINPGYANAWQNLAQSYLAKGMKEETRQALLGLKKTDPSKAAMVDAELKKLSFR